MTETLNQEALRSAFAAEQFQVVDAGRLHIKSGTAAASDPLFDPTPAPFTQLVPNGEHPVTLALAMPAGEGAQPQLAFARVQFSESPAMHWYPALTAEQDARSLAPSDLHGFPVDTGNACFMDPSDSENAVRFSTGLANGRYPSFFGYDHACRVAALVTDFGVVPRIQPPPPPPRKKWWQGLLFFGK